MVSLSTRDDRLLGPKTIPDGFVLYILFMTVVRNTQKTNVNTQTETDVVLGEFEGQTEVKLNRTDLFLFQRATVLKCLYFTNNGV